MPDRYLFYPLLRANFGDLFVIDLPQGVEAYRVESNQWVCMLDADVLVARILIVISDISFADEEDGQPMSVAADLIEKALEDFLAEQRPNRDISRLPGGALSHDIYDSDPSPTDPGEPIDWRSGFLRNHLWRRLCISPHGMRDVQLLLYVPLERAATPHSTALVTLVDREIRRAAFPGFPTVEMDRSAQPP